MASWKMACREVLSCLRAEDGGTVLLDVVPATLSGAVTVDDAVPKTTGDVRAVDRRQHLRRQHHADEPPATSVLVLSVLFLIWKVNSQLCAYSYYAQFSFIDRVDSENY
jgi:hypothetical protein